MARKKDHLPATQPEPDTPASPIKKAKRVSLPSSASKDSPPDESEETEFDVIFETLDGSLALSMTSALLGVQAPDNPLENEGAGLAASPGSSKVRENPLDSKDYHLIGSLLRTYLNIFASLRKAIAGISDTPQGKRVFGHRLELEKKRDAARNEQLLARAEIDRAIARRIATADTVEIEEILDASAKGHAGLSKDENGGQVGIGGVGQRVVKRRIVLKGTTTDGQTENQGDPPAVEADASKPSRGGKASLPHSRGKTTEETEMSHDESAS
jgi:hypothetical protein